MSNHYERMSEMARWLPPPKGTYAYVRMLRAFEAENRKDPKIKKLLEDKWLKAKALVFAQRSNGVEFANPQALREFSHEYSHRAVHHGLRTMPSSMNVLEAYIEYVPNLGVFSLRPEVDHMFSVTSFTDFVTSPCFKGVVTESTDLLPEAKIFSYANIDEKSRFVIRLNDQKEIYLAGISIVRHGNEVVIAATCGERCNLKQRSEELADMKTGARARGKQGIEPSPALARRAASLDKDDSHWRFLVAMRLDLVHRTQQVRYVMHDCGDSWFTITDDPSGFLEGNGEFAAGFTEAEIREMATRVNEYDSVFEMCVTALFLPQYFDTHSNALTFEKHDTNYEKFFKKPHTRKLRAFVPHDERIKFRSVIVLQHELGENNSATVSYVPPRFRVETDGFWRKLAPDKVGADRFGKPIHGRTWVTKRLIWIESDDNASPVTLGASVQRSTLIGPDVGIIYVMHSPSHPMNVFKIGLSRRTSAQRALELSRETGTLDGFLVAREWTTSNCSKAEAKIHARLDQYRINPQKEFFEAEYRIILEVIDEVLAEIDNSS